MKSSLVRKFYAVAAIFIIGLLAASLAFSATTGKISGKILDKKTGESLPGVNVVIEGTTMGAATDIEGRYIIINVRPGDYNLTASIIGYQKMRFEEVHVSADLTTTIDFELSEEVLKGDVTVIRAERPLVQRDQTGSVRVSSSEEIENMPVSSIQEVVGISAGVVQFQDSGNGMVRRRGGQGTSASNLPQLNVRGGRANQVAYIVDGFSVQDPITGRTTATIAPGAVDEIVIMTGGFNAEYGRIMSGAVNVTTRRGQPQFSGKVHAVTDNVGAGSEPQDYNMYDFSFSGPLVPGNDKVSFFVSASRAWERNRTPRANISGKYFDLIADRDSVEMSNSDGSTYNIGTLNTYDAHRSDYTHYRDGVLPGNWRDSWSFQAKIDVDLTDNIKLDMSTIGSTDDYQRYQHRYLFNSEHANYYEDRNLGVNGKMTYQMNKNTVFTVAGNYFGTSRFVGDGVHKHDMMEYARPVQNPNYDATTLYWSWDDIDGPTPTEYGSYAWNQDVWGSESAGWDSVQFVVGGDEGHVNRGAYLKRSSRYVGFDFDVISQIHPDHELKFGVDLQKHKLRYYSAVYANRSWAFLTDPGYAEQDVDLYGYRWDPVERELIETDDPMEGNHDYNYGEPFTDENNNGIYDEGEPFEDTGTGLDGPKEPLTLSFYLQDKFEYEGIVVNYGVRYDYIDVNTEQLVDEHYPLGDPNQEAQPGDADYNNPNRMDKDKDLKDADEQTAFSPRIGIGFPVTDRTVFHANYGIFYQQPRLVDLYVGYTYLDYYVRNSPYFTTVGNPNLDWEKTTAYEFGMRHQLGERSVLEITSYYKSVTDLAQIENVSSFPASFTPYKNSDYGTIKGFDFSFRTMRTNNLATNVSYSLSWATGTGSTSTSSYNSQWHGEDSPKTSAPLDYDQRHKLTFNTDYRYTNNAPIPLLNNFGVNLLGSFASGTPYTPAKTYNEVTEASVTPETNGAINSRYGPWVFRMDMKANKTFQLGGFDMNFYVWVLNLMDRDNAVDVYEGTGDPESTSWLNSPEGVEFQDTYLEAHDSSGLTGEEKYMLKERNPRNYDLPRVVRFGIEIGF
ncbi:MAG: hypothetical protein B6244_01925 [Candidatus Cloacimonetes bacterium 4572_55]|nr:MAG: hypothetical protein B6244_01925 [Candidatus Cloacimonetes bacterium 4572_55]